MNNWSNLSLRLATAAVLIAAFLSALFFAPAPVWFAFVTLFLTAGAWEWAGLFKLPPRARAAYAVLTLALSALLASADIAGLAVAYWPSLLIWVALVPIWLWRGWPLPPAAWGLLLGWLLLMPTLLALLHLRAESPWLLLIVAAIAIVADTAAYFAGRRFGRHKLAPTISPGKTREGALGGAVAVVAYAAIVARAGGHALNITLLAAFLALFVLSVLGDLFESWLKRRAGVKDSGNLLPGHGGVLDRIDSQLAVLPVAALLWIVLGASG
ncbi:MAG: phosphatidate cytidylyltransferase [Gallionellaceae bacterium]|nr:phosphatidate cytidylyltransferase [Gallionellaceae bacterium]